MSCCAPGTEAGLSGGTGGASPTAGELTLASRDLGDGMRQVDLSVPDAHCGACIAKIERELRGLPGVVSARVNLSTRRVAVRYRGEAPPVADVLGRIGYPAHLFEADEAGRDPLLAELIRALAVSGFAAGNIMLLSVSVWSGADDSTRDLFHWLSALIAIPALIFAGRIFFRSAWNALRHGRMNMDVPIALGISLAYGLSLYETMIHGPHAYFDAAVSLLFFLLIGRTLDHVMREKARSTVAGLARLAPRGALALRDDGSRDFVPIGEIEPGMRLQIAAGDRIPVDGIIRSGSSSLDMSIVTGESAPVAARAGQEVKAGALNLEGPVMIEVSAAARDSFLSAMIRLMEAAEGGRARYRRIADRASALYSPVVHVAALLTFLGWMAATGDWHRAITIAIAVLIITCPCALGLAVPIVQVVAARRLFENGIMVKDGSAMERLAEIDTVVFDKTGTLTTGVPEAEVDCDADEEAIAVAVVLAGHSRHPFAQAIARLDTGGLAAPGMISDLREIPGQGMEGRFGGSLWRLGRAAWALPTTREPTSPAVGTVLSRDGLQVARFGFVETLRAGAVDAVRQLKGEGYDVELLSGDHDRAVEAVAQRAGIERYRGGVLPADKVERLHDVAREGRKAAMIGDGLNDAPALGAAHVSLAPATAADVGRNVADFVFLRESLAAVPLAIDVSKSAGKLIRQNFALAIGYNALAVPVAVLGYVTPLVAAVAMSLSSILVIANAMRLGSAARAAADHDRAADTDASSLVAAR
ncbi:MAG: cadmium-translocating P-type ATPase [Rhizobiaceae bacterium]|nr:cadmium-translocating P-type ATPase [Rhizobiaceae bacterium]